MIKAKKTQAVNLNKAFERGADMSAREEQILADIVQKTNFSPMKVIWKSSYWGTSQVGAVHYLGTYHNQHVVLKIQGVKPEVSEIYMIEQFAAQNRSKIIKPPKLFMTISWNDQQGYEAQIMEYVVGKQVLESKKLQTKENIRKFFKFYLEYRQNSLPQKPWLPKPQKPDPVKNIQNLFSTSQKAYPNYPFRESEDNQLAKEAAYLLSQIWKDTDLEFVHGHISAYDLVYQDHKVVLFSNLFWKWKYPFYDAVFGYHWFIYELEHVEGITPNKVEEQRKIWQEELFSLPIVAASKRNIKLLKAALLERAIAGLVLDSFLVDPKRPIAKYLTDSTRKEVKKLMKTLKQSSSASS